MRLLVVLHVLILSTLSAHAITPQYKFERLTIENGLSQNSVYAILQDRQGFMWFGTQNGLNRYDGYEFVVYQHDPANAISLPAGRINVLHEDRTGIIWLGMDVGLVSFNRINGMFRLYEHDPADTTSISDNDISTIKEDRQGRLWIGTNNGLNIFDPSAGYVQKRFYYDPDGKQTTRNRINDILLDHAGDMWVGVRTIDREIDDHAIYHHKISADETAVTRYRVPFLTRIFEDHEQNMWIGAFNDGLNRFDRNTGRMTRVDESFTIGKIAEGPDGVLWGGAIRPETGLVRFDTRSGGLQEIRNDPGNPNSISSNDIASIYRDRSGIIWIGTGASGVNRLNPAPRFTTYTRYLENPDGETDHSVRSFLEEGDSVLWMGTYGGLLRIDNKSNDLKRYPYLAYTLLKDRVGVLWVGEEGDGISSFSTRGGRLSSRNWIVQSEIVFELLEDRRGRLWAGMEDGLIRIDRAKQRVIPYLLHANDPNSAPLRRVFVLHEDTKERLWIGTDGTGLYRLIENPDQDTPYRFQHYLHDPADSTTISSNLIKCIYEDPDGMFWIGTGGSGFNHFDPETGRVTRYSTRDGLPDNVVYGILPDGSGGLWMSTNKGLSRFDLVQKTFRNYTEGDGLQSNEFNTAAFYRSPDGEMFFGGINGYTSFRPEQVQLSNYKPPVVITSLTDPHSQPLVNRYAADLSEVKLSYEQNVFSFSFSSLDYTNPGSNRYAYMLEGFDSDWIETDASRRFATYTNLDAGTYTFRVKATNSDGIWNEDGPSVRVTVTPPPWETWWAYMLYTLAVLSIIFGYVHLQQQKLTRERDYLDRERTFMRLNQELDVARRIQTSLLPQQFPDREDFDIYGKMLPAAEVGGDLFDFFIIDDENLGLMIGDVADKGIGAALFMSMSRTLLRAIARDTLTPATCLSQVNHLLIQDNETSMFVTVWYGMLNLRTGRLQYSNAGHPIPYVLSPRDSEVRRLDPVEGAVLGLFDRAVFKVGSVTLQPGDSLVLYTDGITESTNDAQVLFSEKRLKDLLSQLHDASPEDLVNRVTLEVQNFAGAGALDDITMLAIRFNGGEY